MDHRERVLSALEHRGYDRIPVKHEGTPEVNAMLRGHFGVHDDQALLACVGDDFRYVAPRFVGPERRKFADGSWEGLWGERYNNISFGQGTYPEAVYLPFKEMTRPEELAGYPMPGADWYDPSNLPADCAALAGYAIVTGGPGEPDFINGIARCRGVEQVLNDIADENPVYLALMEQRFQFVYERTERTLQAAQGRIDIVHCGEDLGTQNGLLMSPRTFERLFAHYYRDFYALAHRYGARTMMHSCGSVRKLIPRLIELGLDILDVVQVGAAGMAIAELAREYGAHLSFCGTVDVQTTLPWGTVADVRREVELRQKLFAKGGLFLGPTHAIQVGTPLANILEMYRAAGSLEG